MPEYVEVLKNVFPCYFWPEFGLIYSQGTCAKEQLSVCLAPVLSALLLCRLLINMAKAYVFY